MYSKTNNPQSGIAAIFTVVFFTILISVIILSFVQIVSQDQRQVTNADLSNSAYDSAEAGVEDAKRALEKYRIDCVKTATPASNCDSLYKNATNGALSGAQCDSFQRLASTLNLNLQGSEVKVATNTQDDDLAQAYTCLKIELDTLDYVRSVDSNQTILIPLKIVNDDTFDQIAINWFDKKDSEVPTIPTDTSSFDLPETRDWPGSTPPILRVQVVAVDRNAPNIDDIDQDAKTVFLHPYSNASSNVVQMRNADAVRRSQKNSPVSVLCQSTTTYACNILLTEFEPLSGGVYDYYLRVTPIYNNATIQIVPINTSSATPLRFDGVEPLVDSTGRANDVFRRIVSRVTFEDELSTLNGGAGFDVTQGLCKQFEIADLPTYYQPHCNPSNLVEE